MNDLISRQAAIEAMAELQGRAASKSELLGISKAWKRIKALPSAQKTGRWIDKSGGIEGAWNYCSVCGEQAIDLYDYCPNCGARMEV